MQGLSGHPAVEQNLKQQYFAHGSASRATAGADGAGAGGIGVAVVGKFRVWGPEVSVMTGCRDYGYECLNSGVGNKLRNNGRACAGVQAGHAGKEGG